MHDQLYSDLSLIAAYDSLNSDRRDRDFYRARLPAAPARLLDIGCGTGDFALECARDGYSVLALDPAPGMIAHARAKDRGRTVDWIVGTMAAIAPCQEVDAATMMGHAFQCLLTDADIQALFARIAGCLSPRGSFLFETRNPAICPWEHWTPAHAGPPVTLPTGDGVQVIDDVLSVEGEVVTFTETYHWTSGKAPTRSLSRLRFADRPTITRLAEAAGLRVDAVHGNWDGADFDEATSPELIFRLRPTASYSASAGAP
ncbi:class I SAM-dependent methyltransferase [Marivibrio halodurans]|uniref:Class I SAM-dependent methyltransferase n=1 Tax=Marivibrio halodurans TaxID=2039722 RepID=A0A8J7UZK0_9PROT|nr:class I SAM-dependent methyltransferase [Marivibrio halodurans]MBP5855766.1 class I SAM-dependent methyltransferase [Marivibrio halodurans]